MVHATVGGDPAGLVSLCKKISGASCGEQVSKQHFSVASDSVPAFSFMFELLPWFPLMIDYNLEINERFHLQLIFLSVFIRSKPGQQ